MSRHLLLLTLLVCPIGCGEPVSPAIGPPLGIRLRSADDVVESDNQLVALLFHAMIPVAEGEWSISPTPEPNGKETILVLKYAKEIRWIPIQPEQNTCGTQGQCLVGDLKTMRQIIPIAEQLYRNDYWKSYGDSLTWGTHSVSDAEWIQKQGKPTVDLLLRWMHSENSMHRDFAARFLSLFRDHPETTRIEDEFLKILSDEVQEDLSRQTAEDRTHRHPDCGRVTDHLWLWESLPRIAGEASERQLMEWVSAPLCPEHSRLVTNAAAHVFGLPGEIDMAGFCGVGVTPERAEELTREAWERQLRLQNEFREQLTRLYTVNPQDRLLIVLDLWDKQLTDVEWPHGNEIELALKCARRLQRFRQPSAPWVAEHLNSAETPYARAGWALISFMLGESVDQKVLDNLASGDENERNLAEYLAAAAARAGVAFRK